MNLEIGMEVFLKPTGNISRYNKNIRKGVITKIARKYFYVDIEEYSEQKFDIETLKNINDDCNSAWVLYSSEQEIKDEEERLELLTRVRRYFDWMNNCKLSLEQVREIVKIIDQ